MIDVTFDFTTDSYKYWDGFWERKDGLGAGYSDPDSSSLTLQKYHQILWSRNLPNGEKMDLKAGSGTYYLSWKDFRFGSDSIIVSFRYERYRAMIETIMNQLPDYKSFYEDFLHKTYTIGGMIIFPKHRNSINQNKGTNKLISDRWDLTLECIRRFYINERSPLSDILEKDRNFFELFCDFKGYVDYFFLQDCVSDDYSSVKIWYGNGDFTGDPLPKTSNEYLQFLNDEVDFLNKRNRRIMEYCAKHNI